MESQYATARPVAAPAQADVLLFRQVKQVKQVKQAIVDGSTPRTPQHPRSSVPNGTGRSGTQVHRSSP